MSSPDIGSCTDEELFEQYQKGDAQSFEILYRRYNESLYTFCLRMLGDSDRAADAFQEIYIRVVRFRDSYHRAKPFHAWLFAIARNTCISLYRSERPYETLDAITDDIVMATMPEALDVTERDMIASALASLPPLVRETLLLYEYEGFSYEEIAAMTGSGLSAVKVRIHRARKILRALLGPWLDNQNKD